MGKYICALKAGSTFLNRFDLLIFDLSSTSSSDVLAVASELTKNRISFTNVLALFLSNSNGIFFLLGSAISKAVRGISGSDRSAEARGRRAAEVGGGLQREDLRRGSEMQDHGGERPERLGRGSSGPGRGDEGTDVSGLGVERFLIPELFCSILFNCG